MSCRHHLHPHQMVIRTMPNCIWVRAAERAAVAKVVKAAKVSTVPSQMRLVMTAKPPPLRMIRKTKRLILPVIMIKLKEAPAEWWNENWPYWTVSRSSLERLLDRAFLFRQPECLSIPSEFVLHLIYLKYAIKGPFFAAISTDEPANDQQRKNRFFVCICWGACFRGQAQTLQCNSSFMCGFHSSVVLLHGFIRSPVFTCGILVCKPKKKKKETKNQQRKGYIVGLPEFGMDAKLLPLYSNS